jgi:cell fate regulator YaaT (PSP1 superfamily)
MKQVVMVQSQRGTSVGEIVSLSKARKAKARVAKEQSAAENRVRFGRTKAEKEREAALEKIAQKRLDELKRED